MSVDCGHFRRQAPGDGSWIGIRPWPERPQPAEPTRPGRNNTRASGSGRCVPVYSYHFSSETHFDVAEPAGAEEKGTGRGGGVDAPREFGLAVAPEGDVLDELAGEHVPVGIQNLDGDIQGLLVGGEEEAGGRGGGGAHGGGDAHGVREAGVDGREAGEAVVFDRAGREQRERCEGEGEVFEHDCEVLKGYLEISNLCSIFAMLP